MTETWRTEFVLSSVERELGRTRDLAAAIHRGEVARVARGVYRVTAAVETDPQRRDDDEFLARVRAAELLAPGSLIFAGVAAAAVWGLPRIGPWPDRVPVLSQRADGGRSNGSLKRTYVGFPADTVTRDGIRVTTLARTVADVARTESLECAVAMADRALRGMPGAQGWPPTTRGAVRAELDLLGRVTGITAARGVLSFATGRAESPGESVSRVVIHRLGLTAPVLQQRFEDEAGLIGVVDFWWPQCGVVGEFDGVGKYVRDEFTRGRATADVVLAEKAREDRLRACGPRVVRWGWRDLASPADLGARLRAAGVS
jgi:hypothetical protein